MNWIILRGLVREQRHWGTFTKKLEEGLGAGSKVIPIDLPGFGTEIHRASPATVAGIVMDMRTRWLRDYSNLGAGSKSEEWGILAVSLGGMCALHWAAQFPQDFNKVVLINSSVKGLSPTFKRMIPSNFPTIFKIATENNLFEREKLILTMTTNMRGEILENTARNHAEFLTKSPPAVKNAVAQLTAALRFKAPEKLKTPLLVLSSTTDKLVDQSCSEAISSFYKAPHYVHQSANHDLPADDPEWVISKVKQWAALSAPEQHASPTI